MKKLIAAIFIITIFAVSPISVSAQENTEYLTRADVVKKIIKSLYLPNMDTGFKFEDYYYMYFDGKMHIRFIPDESLLNEGYPILCEIYSEVEGCGFSDISQKNENLYMFLTLAKALGITNGYSDNTFRPDKAITYNDAITMLICAFNFNWLAEARGGYPGGYIKAAEELGIIPGAGFDANSAIDAKSFNNMLTAALDKLSGNIKNFTEIFMPPETAEQCIEAYANAVEGRNGVMQFALYDDGLKSEKRDGFESFNWVTGVSSPWVLEFDIAKIEPFEFEITFHYSTSTGYSGDSRIKLSLSKINGFYRIINIDNLQ